MAVRMGRTPQSRKSGVSSAAQFSGNSRISFAELTSVLEPDGPLSSTESSSWKSIIDRNEQLIIFYQVDYIQASPNISKCVRIRRDRSDTNEDKLVPVVFINQQLQSSYVKDLLGRKYLSLSDGIEESDDEDDIHNPKQSLEIPLVFPSSMTSDASTYLPSFEIGEDASQKYDFHYMPPKWVEDEKKATLPESDSDMEAAEEPQEASETSSEEYAAPSKRKRKSAVKKSGKKGISFGDIVPKKTPQPPVRVRAKYRKHSVEERKRKVKVPAIEWSFKRDSTKVDKSVYQCLSETDNMWVRRSKLEKVQKEAKDMADYARKLMWNVLLTDEDMEQIAAIKRKGAGFVKLFGRSKFETFYDHVESFAVHQKKAVGLEWDKELLTEAQLRVRFTDSLCIKLRAVADGPSKSLSDEQQTMLKKIVQEMHTPGKHKKELLPGSGRYLAVDRLSLLKTKAHKHPLTDAVTLAMAFIGPPQDAIRVFPGSYFGLKAAFGADFVVDVAGWINAHHPAITSGKDQPLTCDLLLAAFSKKMLYYRTSLPSWKRFAPGKIKSKVESNEQEDRKANEEDTANFDFLQAESEPEAEMLEGSSAEEPTKASKLRSSTRSTKKTESRVSYEESEETLAYSITGVAPTDVWDDTKKTGKQKRRVSEVQERLLMQFNLEVKTHARHKQRLFPGSNLYISSSRLAALETQKNISPASFAAKVILAIIGNQETAVQMFPGGYFGLKAAFGQDFLDEITGWINFNLPKIVSGECPALTTGEVCTGFSKKMEYLRNTLPSWKGGKTEEKAAIRITLDEDDNILDNGDDDNETSLVEKPSKKAKSSSKETKESFLSASQKKLLAQLHKEMSTPGKDKKEFPAGSGRYINTVRLDMVKYNPHRSPETWAVEIVLKFMGSQRNALHIFQGKGVGLSAAFGSDFVADITGWVNLHHGAVTSGAVAPITCSDMMNAFSKRLGYWRKQLPSWKTMSDQDEVDSDQNDEGDDE